MLKNVCFLFFTLNVIWIKGEDDSSEELKVVIVGAGASGLHSAYRLAEAGLKNVTVLEAQNRIGGRIISMPLNGDWIELGAQWIHGQEHNPLWIFVKEKGIETVEDPAEDFHEVFLRSDGQQLPDGVLQETVTYLSGLQDECDKWLEIQEQNEVVTSIGEFFDNEFNFWLENEKATDTEEIRVWRKQFYEWWIKTEEVDTASENFRNHSSYAWCDYDDIKPDTNFKNGYQSLLNVYKESLDKAGVPIHLNTKVKTLEWQKEQVIVSTEDGKVFEADFVIFTPSIGYLQKHHSEMFFPRLPSKKIEAVNSIRLGTVDKIYLEFEKPFWDKEQPGFQFLWPLNESLYPINNETWFKQLIGYSGVLNQPNMLLGWIAGEGARYMESLSDEEISEICLAQLENFVANWKKDPQLKLPKLTRIIVTRHNSNPYFLGSYSYREVHSDEKEITHFDISMPLVYAGHPKVLFAGEATTEDFYGTVHGALDSANREVNRILKINSGEYEYDDY